MDFLMTDFIWTPDWLSQDDTEPRIVLFRKAFTLDQKPFGAERVISISADSRYKLYINGEFVQEGPQKALDLIEWYVDAVDIASLLREGRNVISVEVLRCPAARPGVYHYNASLLRSETPMLYVHDSISGEKSLSARAAGWVCLINREIEIIGEDFPVGPAPIYAQERVTATKRFAGWKLPEYDASQWKSCKVWLLTDIIFSNAPFKLTPRSIPPMRHEARNFAGVSMVRECENGRREETAAMYERLLRGKAAALVPPNTVHIIEVCADALDCGYLQYGFERGGGANITVLCAECYSYPQPDIPSPLGGMTRQAPIKCDRTDAERGTLIGCSSYYRVAGCGTPQTPETYEPYWFSTFRYIRLKIETADEPLTITRFSYRSTGYPLNNRTSFAISNEEMRAIWDISVRSLQLCMHETYMDCPFYEQFQYAMDSRTEMLYTYAISADDRLARQAMEAFRRAQRPDGLLNANAPSRYAGVIPCFSLYFILMVYDHMMYFGDEKLVKRYLPVIDQILGFFDRNLSSQGVVKKIGGGLIPGPFWSFIDWTSDWSGGVPTASEEKTGNLTMESLLYLYGLQKSAELARYAGRPGIAEEYDERAKRLADAIRHECVGIYRDAGGKEQPLIQDGCGVARYSVHCQAFAVLTKLVSPKSGQDMLLTAIGNPACAQPSVAFMFYVFRALEVCDLYAYTTELWAPWRNMLKNNMTTCVENETDARSDCHAWGALMCYELPSAIFGVRPAAPGYSQVAVNPQTNLLDEADASVITPRGSVRVAWKKGHEYSVSVPEGMIVRQPISQTNIKE